MRCLETRFAWRELIKIRPLARNRTPKKNLPKIWYPLRKCEGKHPQISLLACVFETPQPSGFSRESRIQGHCEDRYVVTGEKQLITCPSRTELTVTTRLAAEALVLNLNLADNEKNSPTGSHYEFGTASRTSPVLVVSAKWRLTIADVVATSASQCPPPRSQHSCSITS